MKDQRCSLYTNMYFYDMNEEKDNMNLYDEARMRAYKAAGWTMIFVIVSLIAGAFFR